MTFLLATRYLCIAGWFAVWIYTLPSVYALMIGKPRHYDPMRFVAWGFSNLIIAFGLRWVLAPDSDELFAATYVFAIIWAALTVLALRSYGRDSNC